MPKLVCDICFGLVYGEMFLRINTVDDFFSYVGSADLYEKTLEIWLKTEVLIMTSKHHL